MAQCLKIQLPMQETWVQSLGQEDPLKKEMATHSSILAWEIPWTEEPGGLQSGVAKSQTRLSDFAFHFQSICKQFWASLVAQMVKCLHAMRETRV